MEILNRQDPIGHLIQMIEARDIRIQKLEDALRRAVWLLKSFHAPPSSVKDLQDIL